MDDPEPQKTDFSAIKALFESDFRETYSNLSIQEKQATWRNVIKAIYVPNKEVVAPDYFIP